MKSEEQKQKFVIDKLHRVVLFFFLLLVDCPFTGLVHDWFWAEARTYLKPPTESRGDRVLSSLGTIRIRKQMSLDSRPFKHISTRFGLDRANHNCSLTGGQV